MDGPIDVKQKINVSTGCYTDYSTFDSDFDLEFPRSNWISGSGI